MGCDRAGLCPAFANLKLRYFGWRRTLRSHEPFSRVHEMRLTFTNGILASTGSKRPRENPQGLTPVPCSGYLGVVQMNHADV